MVSVLCGTFTHSPIPFSPLSLQDDKVCVFSILLLRGKVQNLRALSTAAQVMYVRKKS